MAPLPVPSPWYRAMQLRARYLSLSYNHPRAPPPRDEDILVNEPIPESFRGPGPSWSIKRPVLFTSGRPTSPVPWEQKCSADGGWKKCGGVESGFSPHRSVIDLRPRDYSTTEGIPAASSCLSTIRRRKICRKSNDWSATTSRRGTRISIMLLLQGRPRMTS